jgi:hypothetical protein
MAGTMNGMAAAVSGSARSGRAELLLSVLRGTPDPEFARDNIEVPVGAKRLSAWFPVSWRTTTDGHARAPRWAYSLSFGPR